MKNNFLKPFLLVLILLAINLLAFWFPFRWDLTEEKRYSLSDATKSMLENLPDEVIVKIYLEGDELPGGFDRLKRAIAETLEEFKTYGGKNIVYRFIDPNAISDTKERETLLKELIEKGMQPTNVMDNKNGHKTETMVFPYATVWHNNKETTVLLLKNNQSLSAQEKLNQSYESLEYELATAIRKVVLTDRKKIGLLTEFTKLQPDNFAGMITALQENYNLYIVDAKTSVTFDGLDALVIPKPDVPVDDSTKLKIDLFIANGGKALFFVDGLKIDSIGLQGTYAQPLDVNLDDLFFRYGVRINKNIVKDGASSALIPMVVGTTGDKPNIQPMPYRFFPMINNFGKSLITKNLDLVSTRFVASMDTILSPEIKKTPLLMTTPYTKILAAPALVTYNEARTETNQDDYKAGVQTIAYLLEGSFKSLYKNRLLPTDKRLALYPQKSVASKLIICSDGDMIVNEVNQKTGNPIPLGFDKMTQHVFGNKDFILNAVDYLIDENGVITARGKEVKLRPLDTLKIRDERSFWQWFNVLVPSLVVVVLGSLRFWFWKRKYA
jgi:ABC-2 type transport system permease protein